MSIPAEDLKQMLEKNKNLAKKNPEAVAMVNAAINLREEGNSTPSAEHKRNKYGNHKVFVYADGYVTDNSRERADAPETVFDSGKEYYRYKELLLLQTVGVITNLRRQVPFVIQEAFFSEANNEKIQAVCYKADFIYEKNGQRYVEDVKGQDKRTGKYLTTPEFRLKWKLLKAKYPDTVFVIV